MSKFIFTNWETVPFKKKSFEGQLERYAKVCVASIDNPQKVLFILPLFGAGFGHIIEAVRCHELGIDDDSVLNFSRLIRPVNGDFVEVPSKHGPLFRVYKPDEAKYGLCSKGEVGKVERDSNGKVKIYHSIKVFTRYRIDNETGEKRYLNGWYPEDWYYHFFGYNYHVLSDLTEPLQL